VEGEVIVWVEGVEVRVRAAALALRTEEVSSAGVGEVVVNGKGEVDEGVG